jgi:hypothetical protein
MVMTPRLNTFAAAPASLLIVAIDGWNRIQVDFRTVHPAGQKQVA